MKPKIIKNIIFFISLALLFSGLSAQNDDTIKVHIQNQIYDTVIIHETVILYDTIWKDPLINSYSLGFTTGSFFSVWRKFSNPIINLSKQRNFSAGVDVELEIDRWKFSSGFYLTEFKQNALFNFTSETIDSSIITQITPHNETHYDTTGVHYEFITFDSIFINPNNTHDTIVITYTDSIPHYDIDTTVVTYNDTVNTIKIDTISRDTIAARNFVYRYAEVPLIFKFRLAEFGKFQIDIGTGFIAGILIKYESYDYNSEAGKIVEHNKDDLYTFLPSLWFSAVINYQISENFLIRLEPYYNPGLRSIYTKELSYIKIPDRYGLRFGLRYCFN
ncbi:MAG TPA: hypothetical protein PKN32_05755 [Bacteroidales bacterium]|nr:hypothetical protein [Bacteroidales bacterium]